MPEEQEKTEQPTQRRQEKARERGEVAKSREISSALVLFVGLIAFKFLGGLIFKGIKGAFAELWASFGPEEVDLMGMLPALIFKLCLILLPLFAILVGAGFLANFAQVGGVFSLQPITPDLSRISPARGFSRIFSRIGLMEAFKSIFKIGAIGYIACSTIKGAIDSLPRLSFADPWGIASYAAGSVLDLGLKVAIFSLLLALIDYLFQRWQYMRNLMMTRRELKEELKETEGDPLIKSRIRERGMQLMRMRMMQEVPKADAVITNPEHIAVAIKYDRRIAPSPIVVAKGADHMAMRIVEIARKHLVPIFRNRPLAWALYESVDVGEMIPEDLYFAVAQIIAQVYRMKGITL